MKCGVCENEPVVGKIYATVEPSPMLCATCMVDFKTALDEFVRRRTTAMPEMQQEWLIDFDAFVTYEMLRAERGHEEPSIQRFRQEVAFLSGAGLSTH